MLDTLSALMAAEHIIAATPGSWERVSHIMSHIANRDARMIMIAGTVGTSVATEFLRVAEDAEATVNLDALVQAQRKSRAPLYPDTLHGLNALIFGLSAYVNDDTVDNVIKCTLDIRELQIMKPKSKGLKSIPLHKLATVGVEMIIETSLQKGLTDRILAPPACNEHQETWMLQRLV